MADDNERDARSDSSPSVAVPTAPPAARRDALHRLIQERRFITVAEVARSTGISEMTVRRDLAALTREGKVRRSHGGAVPPLHLVEQEPSFAARRGVQAAAKRAIARAAARLVGPREVIGLDVGSTVAAVATELRGRAGLSVVTNSLQAATILSAGATPVDIYMLGGQVRVAEGSVCGPIALRQLRDYWLEKAFIGVAGLDATGIFDYSLDDAQVKRGFMERAAEAIVLCDASKFGHRSLVAVSGFEGIAALVTDASPPPDLQAALSAHQVRVVVAGPQRLADLPEAG
jgi:DeoR family glycerol-3-phosphate regulon repressor